MSAVFSTRSSEGSASFDSFHTSLETIVLEAGCKKIDYY